MSRRTLVALLGTAIASPAASACDWPRFYYAAPPVVLYAYPMYVVTCEPPPVVCPPAMIAPPAVVPQVQPAAPPKVMPSKPAGTAEVVPFSPIAPATYPDTVKPDVPKPIPAITPNPVGERPGDRIPKIDLPLLPPKVDAPKLDLPKLDVPMKTESPKLDLPKLDVPMKTESPKLELPPLSPPSVSPKIELPPLVVPSTSQYRPTPVAVSLFPVDGKPPANGSYAVGFFNYTDREMTLTVEGSKISLPKKSTVTATVPATFTWKTTDSDTRTTSIPGGAAGLEVVLK